MNKNLVFRYILVCFEGTITLLFLLSNLHHYREALRVVLESHHHSSGRFVSQLLKCPLKMIKTREELQLKELIFDGRTSIILIETNEVRARSLQRPYNVLTPCAGWGTSNFILHLTLLSKNRGLYCDQLSLKLLFSLFLVE